MNTINKALIGGVSTIAVAAIGFLGYTQLSPKEGQKSINIEQDPLQQLLGLDIESNNKADFFTDNLYPYQRSTSDAIASCMATSPTSAEEGIVYGKVDAAELALMLQEKEDGIFKREDVRAEIMPVFGYSAVLDSSINWDWMPDEYRYEFYVTPGEEPFWKCYFDLTSETEFFPRFFEQTSYKIITLDSPDITAITDDTGSSNSDGITNDNTLFISGTSQADATITIYIDGTSVGNTTADSNGNFTFDYTGTPLADGIYNATATSSINGSNESAESTPFPISIDTTPPTVTINAPTSGAPVSGITEPGATVVVTTPSGATCTTTANAAGYYACTLEPEPLDGEDVTAVATDPAGNTGTTTETDAIANDQTPPPAPENPADLIDASDTGTDNQDNITSETLPTFETYCTENNSIIKLYIDGDMVGTATCSSATDTPQITLTTPLIEGVHTIEYTETDENGNESPKSPILDILVDTTAPTGTPELISPSEPTSNLNASLVGKCGADAENGKVEITTTPANGFSPYPATQSPLDGNGNFEISGLTWTEGTYDVIINCYDKADNGPTTSTQGPVIIDSSAPSAPADAPDLIDSSDSGTDNQDNITNDTTPTFDVPCEEAGVDVTLYNGTTVIGTGTCGAIGTDIQITVTTPMTEGPHNISYTYTDDLGNESGKSPALPIVIDTTAPTDEPNLISPVIPTNNDQAPITGTCGADAENGLVTVASTPANGFTTTEGNTTPYPATEIPLDGLGNFNIPVTWNEGEWMLTISCTDKVGNGPTTKIEGPVIIDLTPPDISGVNPDLQAASDTGISDTDNITSNTLPVFDVECTEDNSVITLYIDGVPLDDTQNCTNAGDTVTFTAPNALTDGNHDITHTETDYVGNVSTQSAGITITVDTTPPTVTITEPADSNTISGTTEPGATVVLTTPSGATCTVIADNSGNWSCTLAPDAISGEIVTATATDPAGNTATDTVVLNTCTVTAYGTAVLGTNAYGETCGSDYVPTGNPDTANTLLNTLVNIGVLANDSDPNGDTLTITNLSTPANGTATIVGNQVEYTPNNGFTGTDSFTYTPNDGTGDGNVTTVNITIVSSCTDNEYDEATFDSCNVFE